MLGTISDVTDQATKKSLKVLDKNETRRERLWKDCVEQAQQLVKANDEIRFKIVALAEKCCVIHLGGKAAGNRFTVERFAKEIGIASGTLHAWIRMYKVAEAVTDGTDKKPQDMKWNECRRVSDRVKGQVFNVRDPNFKKIAKKEFKIYDSQTESTKKMDDYKRHLTSILFNVKNKQMLKDCDRAVLAEILHMAREISKHLNWVDFETKPRKKT